ncbi:hypothetical protein OIO90_004862 [Microbotryomycetes sp. JL221]|nr:hypothetical protein OIO90_004862 [Microbotryomycetes sp. JL221]
MDATPTSYRAIEQTFIFTALILTTCFACKRSPNGFASHRWINRTLSSSLTTLVLIDSALFLYATGVVQAINAQTEAACSIGIIFCFVFYAITKVLLFWFYTERIFLVYSHPVTGSTDHSPSRVRSVWYVGSTLLMATWSCAGMTMLLGRISYRDIGGTCFIGLKFYAGVTVVILQATCNTYCLIAFLIALSCSWLQGEARKMARNSAIAVSVALVTTGLNIGGLVIEHKGLASWICVVCCGSDVVINALVLFLITPPTSQERTSSSKLVVDLQNMTKIVPRSTKRQGRATCFVSRFGTSSPDPPVVVPGVGFVAPLTPIEMRRDSVESELTPAGVNGSFKWDSADPEKGGQSPYGAPWR